MEAYIGLKLYRQYKDYRSNILFKEYKVTELSRKFATVCLVGSEFVTEKILRKSNPNGTFVQEDKVGAIIYHTHETLLRRLRISKAQTILKDVTRWQYNSWEVGAHEKLIRKLSEALEALTDPSLITEDLIWQNQHSTEKSQTSKVNSESLQRTHEITDKVTTL